MDEVVENTFSRRPIRIFAEQQIHAGSPFKLFTLLVKFSKMLIL